MINYLRGYHEGRSTVDLGDSELRRDHRLDHVLQTRMLNEVDPKRGGNLYPRSQSLPT